MVCVKCEIQIQRENMKIYKFRPLGSCKDLERIEDILENGFYCNDFLSFNDINEGVYSHSAELSKETISNVLRDKYRYKICSFSKDGELKALDNELLWGHYANAGKGIAIEIEIDDTIVDCDVLNDCKFVTVKYGQNNFDTISSVDKLLSTKSKAWKYENEIRYLSLDQDCNFVKEGKITKIYFGTPYKSLTNYNEILEKNKTLSEYIKYKNKLSCLLACKEIAFDEHTFDLREN